MNNFVRLSLSIQDIFSFYFLLHNFEKEKKRGNEDRRSINEPERGEEKEEEKVTDC
jgi:hypothetical protein